MNARKSEKSANVAWVSALSLEVYVFYQAIGSRGSVSDLAGGGTESAFAWTALKASSVMRCSKRWFAQIS